MSYMCGGGRGTGGRGTGCRRTQRSPTGRRVAEEAGALAGEAMGGGGRGTRWWWGVTRRSRKRCSPTGEAWGRGGRGTMSGSARLGDAGLGYAGSGVTGLGRRRGVGRVARGRTGGVGGCTESIGWTHEVQLVS
jgi:hypothetical protein